MTIRDEEYRKEILSRFPRSELADACKFIDELLASPCGILPRNAERTEPFPPAEGPKAEEPAPSEEPKVSSKSLRGGLE